MWSFGDRKLIMQGYKYKIDIVILQSSTHFKKNLKKLIDWLYCLVFFIILC